VSPGIRRAWLALNVLVTLALLPALFPDAGSDGHTTVTATIPVSIRSIEGAATTTTTSAPPATTTTVAAPVAVQQKAAAPATTTTAAPTPKPKPKPTTTTTEAYVAPPPPAVPPASGSESGRATWYDHQPGICAHKTLPFGTVVTVHAVNGKSVQCTVGDRGPFVDGYVIDLHWREFEQLTSRDAGRIDVTITW
jgi:rare lipoprotein A (peptidoglycan hydrolase)